MSEVSSEHESVYDGGILSVIRKQWEKIVWCSEALNKVARRSSGNIIKFLKKSNPIGWQGILLEVKINDFKLSQNNEHELYLFCQLLAISPALLIWSLGKILLWCFKENSEVTLHDYLCELNMSFFFFLNVHP